MPHQALVPVQLDAIPGFVGDETEWPGADRVLAAVEILGGGIGPDGVADDRDLSQVDRQQRIDALRRETDRVRIDDLRGCDRLGVDRERAWAVRNPGHAIKRKDDVLRRERVAVVECRGPELELPGLVVDALPTLGQARHGPGSGVHVHQRFVDVRGQSQIGREIVIVRVDAGDGRANGEGQRLRARDPAANAGRRMPRSHRFRTVRRSGTMHISKIHLRALRAYSRAIICRLGSPVERVRPGPA